MFFLSSFDALANGLKSWIVVRSGQLQECFSKSHEFLQQMHTSKQQQKSNTSFRDWNYVSSFEYKSFLLFSLLLHLYNAVYEIEIPKIAFQF